MKLHNLLLPLGATGGLIYAAVSIAATQPVSEIAEPVLAPPQPSFERAIAAVGLVEPSSEPVNLGSLRSGIVSEVMVKTGDSVEKTQPVLRLRSDDLEHELMVANAAKNQAEAQVEAATKKATAAEAEIKAAAAELEQARRLLLFVEDAGDRRLVSGEEVSQRESAVKFHDAKVEAAKAHAKVAEAGVAEAAASLAVASARCKAIENEIARCTVTAPMNATVLQIRVRPGEHLSADASMGSGVLLGVTSEWHVRADVDEHEAWKVRENAPAEAQVRGNPQQRMKLTFVRFEPLVIPKRNLTGESLERVDTRVLQVIYRVDSNHQFRLFAGQQMDVFISALHP
jgi:HlyD family secretion protein